MHFWKNFRQPFFNILGLLLAGVLYAVGIKYFVVPSRVILTGFEGVSLSLSYYWDNFHLFILLYLIFQFFLFVFAFFYLSKRFAFFTGILVSVVVLLLPILPPMAFASPESKDERIILVIFGGLILGAAKALAFKSHGSAGDEDVIATYISQKKLKPVGTIVVTAGVISTSIGLFLTYLKTHEVESIVNTLMYTSIYIFVSAVTLNRFFKKYQLTKVITVTPNLNQVAGAIMSVSNNRTYTVQDSTGGYSKSKQSLISVIIPHDELDLYLKAIKEADKAAFIYYHNIEGVETPIHIRPIS